MELRNLDSLGLTRSSSDIHLANLADRNFPASVSPVGWPFRLDDLRHSTDAPKITSEIWTTRTETAALSDLCLFWLSLDGVEHPAQIKLTYISEMDGEHHNPSAVIADRPR